MTTMRTRFAMVPEWVETRITDGTALRVYVRLARRYADGDRHCFPSEEHLADELNISRATVERAIRTLRQADAILVTRARKPDGNGGPNRYTLPMDDPRDDAMHHPSNLRGGPEQGEQGVSAGRNHPSNLRDQNQTHLTNQTQEKSAVAPPPLRDDDKDQKSADAPPPPRGDDPHEDHPSADDHRPSTAEPDTLDQIMTKVSDYVDGFNTGGEESTAYDMLVRGVHYRKVGNTILKLRWDG